MNNAQEALEVADKTSTNLRIRAAEHQHPPLSIEGNACITLAAELRRLTVLRPMSEAPQGCFLVDVSSDKCTYMVYKKTASSPITLWPSGDTFRMTASGWLPLPTPSNAGSTK